jgi:hypothetical protein
LSPHEGIPHESKEEQGEYENEDGHGKSLYQEKYSRKNGDDEQKKIRDNVFPRDLHCGEPLRAALLEKQGAQPAFPECAGFPVIITVRTMSADQPELKDKDENKIRCNPDDAGLQEYIHADTVDQERQKV